MDCKHAWQRYFDRAANAYVYRCMHCGELRLES